MLLRVKKIIGRCLYGVAKHLPESYASVNIGQKKIRAFATKLILDKCGQDINIEKGAIFATNLEIGNNSGIGTNSRIAGKCIIGNNVMMGPECMIFTKNHNIERIDIPMCKQGNEKDKPVIIDDDVWIGARVTILPGVHIYTGSVIAAGAVVTNDVNEYTVVGGVPAKTLHSRIDKVQMI